VIPKDIALHKYILTHNVVKQLQHKVDNELYESQHDLHNSFPI